MVFFHDYLYITLGLYFVIHSICQKFSISSSVSTGTVSVRFRGPKCLHTQNPKITVAKSTIDITDTVTFLSCIDALVDESGSSSTIT